MSSTNRGGQRSESDNYPTPPWVTHRLLDRNVLPTGGAWYEPCAGEGAIIKAVQQRFSMPWYATELRAEARPLLEKVIDSQRIHIGDCLVPNPHDPDFKRAVEISVVITNPAFRIAYQVIQTMLRRHPRAYLALLLRLNFISSAQRHQFMTTFAPDVHVLPNRPPFKRWGKTDSPEYAWFVWPPAPRARKVGIIDVLDLTPLEERRRCSPQGNIEEDDED